jgi:hypothetical protein
MRMKFMYIQSDAYQLIFDEYCKVDTRFRLETLKIENFVHLRNSASAVATLNIRAPTKSPFFAACDANSGRRAKNQR